MAKPVWAERQWFEVWYDDGREQRRVDRRRRTEATAERIADELRATKNYVQVWLVEVNRLGCDLLGEGDNDR